MMRTALVLWLVLFVASPSYGADKTITWKHDGGLVTHFNVWINSVSDDLARLHAKHNSTARTSVIPLPDSCESVYVTVEACNADLCNISAAREFSVPCKAPQAPKKPVLVDSTVGNGI